MVLKNPNEYTGGKTAVYFVRHGDRIHIPGMKGLGAKHPGPGLSKLGRKQAKDVAKKFSKIKDEIDVFYCSTMTRAKETADEISKLIGKKPIIIHEFSEVPKILEHPKIFSKDYWKARKQFKSAQILLDKVLEKNKEKVIVIVAHGRLIKMLIGRKLGLSHSKSNIFDYHNCHISLVRFKGKDLDYIHYFNNQELTDTRPPTIG